ncbi:hypothetical protein MML48_1g16484 [Holotrichia oblita]|uniref:Uncharacterized protein n=1 Tax=Holotrichia oblita TaxID=644536 RepID=A0ACB9TW51_HOLOL|nr:hypothetical protein MML48_1g16484 [Holotrichia oblita]
MIHINGQICFAIYVISAILLELVLLYNSLTYLHIYLVFFRLPFRCLVIIDKLFCNISYNNYARKCFKIVSIIAINRFWTVKNVTGRLMVGLRWWNYVDDEGQSHWVFESRKGQNQNRVNEREARIFWTSLILVPLLWGLFFIVALLGFSFQWLLLVIIALVLSGANLYGYIKCKVGQSQSLGTVTSEFLKKQVLQGAVSIVSRQSTTPNANPMSSPTSTV